MSDLSNSIPLSYSIFKMMLEYIMSEKIEIPENVDAEEYLKSIWKKVLWWYEYLWIEEKIIERIEMLLDNKAKMWVDINEYVKLKTLESPEVFLSSLIKECNVDFYSPENMWLIKQVSVKDVPLQLNDAKEAGVENKYNWTIGILKDSDWNVVSNSRIKEVLKSMSFEEKDLNSLLLYQPWPWIELFRKSIELLIEYEEKIYDWEEKRWFVTRAYFIPGGSAWIALFRDYFLEEWDLVLLPNYRWPNVDGMIINKTKVIPTELNLIARDWSIRFSDLEKKIDVAIRQWRKKISLYLNFPNNPSWTRMSEEDANVLNDLLKKYSEVDVKFQILVDDPYGVFSIKKNQNDTRISVITTPVSYYIDTTRNVTVVELWSHGTKEAGVYWFRSWILRVFTSKDEVSDMEFFLNKAVRETFSFSPIFPQYVIYKAIVWWDIDTIEDLNSLSQDEIEKRLHKYIIWREKMIGAVYPKLGELKDAILDKCWEYLMVTDNNWEVWWFVLNFVLTDKAKELWLDLDELRKVCINLEKSCWFAVFQDKLNQEKLMRVTLIAWDVWEYADRVFRGIEFFLGGVISNNSS